MSPIYLSWILVCIFLHWGKKIETRGMFNRASACKSSPKFVSRVLGIVNFSECSLAPAMLNMPPLLTAAFNCYIIWCIIQYHSSLIRLTLGGPKIIPFQYVRLISSSLSNPQLILPSPDPFWPWSSSSNSLKFLGTERKK